MERDKSISKSDILLYLKSIKKDFSKRGIEKIALFGSFSKDCQNIYSDIDIAIKKEKNFLKKYSPYYYFEIVSNIKTSLRREFGKNVDVLDLDSKPPFLKSIERDMVYV
ncbi:MAG: nucleotidyltransferase domain-containing protein [Epsilonproteobacteria bacterium]|nr:nucleotidyltransferase domain-containing protein [Campylobacterota bacterium]